MIVALQNDPFPLRMEEDGGIRVAETEVQLEWVIEAHENGTDPETIVRWFDRLRLADVYAVISFYLNHKAEVRQYILERDRQAQEIRDKIEAGQPDRSKLREKLLTRQAAIRSTDAAPGK
jgi:uncharacterized protein (DUF433 family)